MQAGEWEENMGSHWGALKVNVVNPPERQRLQIYCFNTKTKTAEMCLLYCGSAAPGKVPFYEDKLILVFGKKDANPLRKTLVSSLLSFTKPYWKVNEECQI